LNRFCCSGQDAINLAAAKIMSGMESLLVAGGVEQLSRVPMFADKGAWFSDPKVMKKTRFMHMGLSADLIAVQHGYQRETLDALTVSSHQRAQAAIAAGHFDHALVPLLDSSGQPLLSQDNGVRANTNADSLAKLPPAFAEAVPLAQPLVSQEYPGTELEARHSAANAPALVDGASLLLLASKQRCEELGLRPRARIRHFSNASDNPVKMLTGHIRATEKLLDASGLKPADIDLWEVNESFAASVLLYQESFAIDSDRLNIDGGAMALGHPLGATGGNLFATLLGALEREDKHRGIVSICGGAGVGTTTLIERL
ncbi:MAG: acetyl-CoA C-acyltransferase, partial [Cellvibrionaceae bacterium]|nr:acetyl-CoA C-acyltransferase [Cellvibrionaceae bacterium]